jgi:hypothetical protein
VSSGIDTDRDRPDHPAPGRPVRHTSNGPWVVRPPRSRRSRSLRHLRCAARAGRAARARDHRPRSPPVTRRAARGGQGRRPLLELHGRGCRGGPRFGPLAGPGASPRPSRRRTRSWPTFGPISDRDGIGGLVHAFVNTDDRDLEPLRRATSSRAASACPTSPTTARSSTPTSARHTGATSSAC